MVVKKINLNKVCLVVLSGWCVPKKNHKQKQYKIILKTTKQAVKIYLEALIVPYSRGLKL